jgi:hypothetical protein
MYSVARDYTFTIGEHRFGFMDANHDFQGDVTLLFAGRLGGYYRVPVSAAAGWGITGVGDCGVAGCGGVAGISPPTSAWRIVGPMSGGAFAHAPASLGQR